MKKKTLALLLSCVLIGVLLTVGTVLAGAANIRERADEPYATGDVTYPVEGGNLYFNKSTKTLTDCDETVTFAAIPAQIDGVPVEKLGSQVFRNCTKLTGVTIPEGVIEIGDHAFYACESLLELRIPASVTNIGKPPFMSCRSLQSIRVAEGNPAFLSDSKGVLFNKDKTKLLAAPGALTGKYTIPGSVTVIGENGFVLCEKLTAVDIPKSVQTIEQMAFGGCIKLVSVTIPEGITEIPAFGFIFCESLTEVNLPNSLKHITVSSFAECKSLENIDIPDGVETIRGSAFQDCTSLKEVVIPATVDSIALQSFANCSALEKVTVLGTLTSIGDKAFYGCSKLTSINLPEGLIRIRNSSFRDCSALKDFSIPSTVTEIGEWAFCGCTSLPNLTLPTGLKKLSRGAFSGCVGLKEIIIPEGITEIPYRAFHQCKPTKLILNDGLLTIGEEAFESNRLTSLTIPDSVTTIGDRCFFSSNELTQLTLGKNLTSLGERAFAGCDELKSLIIPDSVISIGDNCFLGCSDLETLTLGKNLQSIGNQAFFANEKLKEVTIPASVVSIGYGPFAGNNFSHMDNIWVDKNNAAYCSDENGVLYNKDKTVLIQCPLWKLGTYTVPEGVTTILPYAFGECSRLDAVILPESLELIDDKAFYNIRGPISIYCKGAAPALGKDPFAYLHAAPAEPVFYYIAGKDGWTTPTWNDYPTKQWTSVPDAHYHFFNYSHDVQTACDHPGYYVFTCKCGEEAKEERGYSYVKDHTWGEGVVTREPTCTKSGEILTTCTVCQATKTEAIPSTGHTYEVTGVTEATCLEWGYTTYTCHCGSYYNEQTEEALGHNWDEGVVKVEPTCTTSGYAVYSCTRCTATKNEVIPVTDHTYEETVTAPTCTEAGYTTYTCACGSTYTEPTGEALGHNWDEGVVKVEPTCTTSGYAVYSCTRCAVTDVKAIPATGHTYEETVVAPTCTEAGHTIYTCSCGSTYTEPGEEALGHAWDEGTVTVEPTTEQPGECLFTCTRCGKTKTVELPKNCDGGDGCPSGGFSDVSHHSWFHDAVDFAVNHGLFNGMSDNAFEPETAMTRAMLVTVLYRYAGTPEEGENHFSDVPDGKWYTKAVAWAAHNGVVSGVGDNLFDPNSKISRQQIATILFRYTKTLGIAVNDRAELGSFPDGDSTGNYAKEAMQWAIAEGLINGISDGDAIYLQPKGDATRAQVATILMRFIGNIVQMHEG